MQYTTALYDSAGLEFYNHGRDKPFDHNDNSLTISFYCIIIWSVITTEFINQYTVCQLYSPDLTICCCVAKIEAGVEKWGGGCSCSPLVQMKV